MDLDLPPRDHSDPVKSRRVIRFIWRAGYDQMDGMLTGVTAIENDNELIRISGLL